MRYCVLFPLHIMLVIGAVGTFYKGYLPVSAMFVLLWLVTLLPVLGVFPREDM